MVSEKPSTFLFVGHDDRLKEKAIKDLSSHFLDTSTRQLDYKMFYGDETTAGEILDYVRTMPFMAAKRFAVVKDFDALPAKDKASLVEYIKNPARSSCLILDAKDDSILEDHEDLGKFTEIKRFGYPEGSELVAWIRQYLDKQGKKIDGDAMEMLKELEGQNVAYITNELEKLIAFAGERPMLGVNDVGEVRGKSAVSSAFDLAGAISDNSVGEAMAIISELLVTGKKPHEIIGILCWHFKRLARAKMLSGRGESDSRILNVLKIGRKYSADFLKNLKRYDIKDIASKMEILLAADLEIKRTKYNPSLVLEFTVMKLCLSE